MADLRDGPHSSARIDAHQHFWQYSQEEHGWIDDAMAALQRDFLPQHLAPELASAGLDAAVSVQARQTLEETYWLLGLAASHPWICGVIGWAPIGSPGFAAELERLREFPRLKGLRHIVQAEPDPEFLLRDDFNRGIRAMRGSGLAYDLLIYEHQLPQAIRFVDQHPNQLFVLDHIAKPCIAGHSTDPWNAHLREIARRPHVYCKLSGLVTEAEWHSWTPEDLMPYAEVVLDAFGPRRIMSGSDWPVCTLAATYGEWTSTLHLLLRSLSSAEQAFVLGKTAVEAYRLAPPCAQRQTMTA